MARSKKSFTVDRKTWLHAGVLAVDGAAIKRAAALKLTLNQVATTPCSELYSESVKMMCCLGFVSNQCGVPKKAMAGVASPTNIGSHEEKLFDILIEDPKGEYDYTILDETNLAMAAMSINDDDSLTNKERESRLKDLFKKHGFTLKFTGAYPKRPVRIKEFKA
jgi:hypothetical protein